MRSSRRDGGTVRQAGAVPPAAREVLRTGGEMLRIGDAERDAAAAELGDHYVAGRLTLDELHERLSRVFAVKTQGQLARLMADLPGPGQRRTPQPPGPAGAPHQGRGQGEHAGADHTARFAALTLLLVAMLIWLFTVMLFTMHGYAYPQHPPPWVRYPTGP